MRNYNYQELLDSRTPQQLQQALEVQKRVLRTKEQAQRYYKAKEAKFFRNIIFRCKTVTM
jgi:hypothetical protein